MARPLIAILLAGRLRPRSTGESLDVPALCLPMGSHGTLLDLWLDALTPLKGLCEVRVVVNTPTEKSAVHATVTRAFAKGARDFKVDVRSEPSPWRGAGGIVRDVVDDVADDALIVVCEAKRLPPPSIADLLRAFETDQTLSGIVGLCTRQEPAGVYMFTRHALSLVPTIGYSDLKEQIFPTLHREGHRVSTCMIAEGVWMVHDRKTYLAAVRQSMAGDDCARIRISHHAALESARLEGCCIVEDGAVIERGAVLHDSVILWGATIGEGAVVTRSVVGSLAHVPPRSIIRDSVFSSEHQWDVPQLSESPSSRFRRLFPLRFLG